MDSDVIKTGRGYYLVISGTANTSTTFDPLTFNILISTSLTRGCVKENRNGILNGSIVSRFPIARGNFLHCSAEWETRGGMWMDGSSSGSGGDEGMVMIEVCGDGSYEKAKNRT